jgi:hypothetical protein
MYTALIQPDPRFDKNNNKLLKFKIPLRIKVFEWYLWKKKWYGSKKCVFFCHQESVFSSDGVLLDLDGQSSN